MKYLWTICFACLLLFPLRGQALKGKVTDKKGNTIPGTGIWIPGHDRGTLTDENGSFTLLLNAVDLQKDTVVFSCLGFETLKTALKYYDLDKEQEIVLQESSMSLEEVSVLARRPISEEFSVQRLSQLDIYQNPAANADPLKAITLLPASTNTDESANPSLRGSNAERSRVIVNGMPVNSPVRFSQLNNIGNFSLFNTAMISHEYVYASNPPLAYGNSTAGIVEIETYSDPLPKSGTQASLSLGSAGFMRNQRLHSDSNYVQLYGNYGFGDGLIRLNKKTIDDRLNSYHTLDGGVNLHLKTGSYSSLNLYSYVTREKSNYRMWMYTWEENAVKEKTRNFNIISFRYQKERNGISFSHGNDFSREHLQFGNMLYQPRSVRFYTTAGYKRVEDRITAQAGISHEYASFDMNDSRMPSYYYAMSPRSPFHMQDSLISQHRAEAYVYGKGYLTKRFILSGGVRMGLPLSGQSFRLSRQVGLRYNWNKQHSTLLGIGKYYGQAEPNYYNLSYLPQTATHYTLDYQFSRGKTKIQGAVYYKEETGDYTTNYIDRSNRRKILGAELFMQQEMITHFNVSGSYTYLRSKEKINGSTFPASNSLPYLVKLSVSYQNLRVGTFALSYMARSGLRFTPVTGSEYDPATQFYAPIYEQPINSAQMKPYHRIDFTANKLLFIGESTLITYCAINNILNIKNNKERLYNGDYSRFSYDYYDCRIIYFGMMFNF